MRAMEPRETGYATNPRDGVRSSYEVFGPAEAERTLLLLPTWSLVHSRMWKMQVPYFARSGMRVVTFDGRGNGRSDAPATGYAATDFAADAVAVMNAAGMSSAAIVGFSAGGRWAAHLAVEQSARIERVVMIAPSLSISGQPRMPLEAFTNPPSDRDGWHKYNAVHWRENLPDFRAWFATQIFSEPHSTKGVDDIVAWSRGVTPDTLIQTILESPTPEMAELWPSIAVPLLIIHGSDDHVTSFDNTSALAAALPHAELAVIEGGGHAPHARDPVKVNLLIREFLDRRLPVADGSEPADRAQLNVGVKGRLEEAGEHARA